MALFIVSVSELTDYIAEKFEKDEWLNQVAVEGELSNCKFSQGHLYFTLKDERAELKGVMYKGRASALPFIPQDGQKVIVFGQVAVYKKRGMYQIYAEVIEPLGIGALYLKFEQTKEKLRDKGYFAEERKKKLPRYPEKIGIVTSKSGAAIRDILTTIKKRWPKATLYLVPVAVQGDEAPGQIVKALNLLNRYKLCEVIILARGGGSFEELAAFNEEAVADAIFASKIPVVTGIGHETDTSIADMVADCRAPTPTGAAVEATPNLAEIWNNLREQRQKMVKALANYFRQEQKNLEFQEKRIFRAYEKLITDKSREVAEGLTRLLRSFKTTFQQEKNRLNLLKDKLILLSPYHRHKQQKEKLEELRERLFLRCAELLKRNQAVLFQQNLRLRTSVKNLVLQKNLVLSSYEERLKLLNPLKILKRGYAVVFDFEGRVVTSVNNLPERFKIKFSDGEALAKTLGKNIIKGDEKDDL
ncbi:exodeoxyribonuclease VII large subunit [Carboxydothermus islandicus]|uniref:Exodeoxyribonuclease 7 large subunit n=1 Tax=Carboxydothermus islandicus TaxID=661089 RepID=A0A1L8D392_9THEO|nr:exodeoxyribonuclease VII large subunit [Carboxydothermus islandicus]GAV25655.1 exodeoxyribonuclease VII large subunit [Carboxydothermus islandicus]